MPTLRIYTDGAAKQGDGAAGIGVFVDRTEGSIEIAEPIGSESSLVAELRAIQRGILVAETLATSAEIWTDWRPAPRFLYGACRRCPPRLYARAGGLIEAIRAALRRNPQVRILYVPKRNRVPGHERAHRLARAGMRGESVAAPSRREREAILERNGR